MKKMLSLLLVFMLVLSMATSAFAAEGTDCSEQPQEQEDQTAPTVSTLEELQAAIAAAKDGDTIAISAEITLDAVTLETNKRIVIIRSDTYPSGTLIRLYNGARISGFIFEEPTDSTIICVSSWETAIEIKNCQFIGNSMNTQSFINAYGGINYPNQVKIDSCYFDGATKSAIVCTNRLTLTITDSALTNNSSSTQGGAIYSGGTLILNNCIITDNRAVAGGGIYCNGDLTLTNCQFSGDEVENKMYGTDILSLGTLSITDEQVDGAGYYEESTGQKVTLPLTDHANVAKLIYLTDEQAAEYFAPEEPDNPDDTEDNEQNGGEDNSNPDEPDEGEPDNPAETPSDPPEQPDNGEDGDTPIEPEEPPTTPEEPQDKPDSSDDDYEPPVYRPVRPTKPVEPEPQPAPALICNNAVIDTSRSAKLQGYGDGLLHEDDSLSRAQMATIVYRLLDDESVAALSAPSSSFTDVDADAWYAPSVLALADAGVVGGTGGGCFAPNSPTTWAQLLTVLGRFVEPQECPLQLIQYDGWAREAVQSAVAYGWLEDSADFNADAVVSRGELVEFINGILELYR
ncbi:S-layer homology domain-containing protein [Dysosmobacter sp.]|uniref:S-layer homology domain-containing protein n=1 Tax=Dysosmobacter sp. TaxID=2591382 RepID=UPI002A89DAE0|nr:S-layer homology domain-containing protein [Dysosmobacter sp.]MDY3984154.1 S-layer homology domain-containing protein [Dysosmobacter sp.]